MTMPVQHVKPSLLNKKDPTATCAGCKKDPEAAPDAELWTIWAPTMYYCPTCAKAEGIGPNDD
jgi:hypothetical protein